MYYQTVDKKQSFKNTAIYNSIMEKKYFADVVINKEKLSDGSPVFVAHCPSLGIASQGESIDKAMENIKEAVELYLEEQPERYEELSNDKSPLFSVIV